MAGQEHPNERVLRASRLFAPVEPEIVARLARVAVRSRFARGELLWRAHDPALHFTVIVAGLVKIAAIQADGGESILGLFGPRESIGDMAALGRKPYPASAIAATSVVEIVNVDANAVREAAASHASLSGALQASLIEHAEALQHKIRIMSAGAVPKRLATLLLYLASRFGDVTDDGATVIGVTLSRAECARLVGATVETTIRTFSRWHKDGVVQTTAQGFVVRDVGKLEALVAQ